MCVVAFYRMLIRSNLHFLDLYSLSVVHYIANAIELKTSLFKISYLLKFHIKSAMFFANKTDTKKNISIYSHSRNFLFDALHFADNGAAL